MPAAPFELALLLAALPLPGVLLLLRLGLHRDLADAGTAAAAAGLLALAVASIAGLGAALAGHCGPGPVAALLLVAAAGLAVVGGPGPRGLLAELRALPRPRPRPVPALAAAVAVLLLGLLYLRPDEQFLGGWDPGVYVNTGASIAASGAIAIHDPVLAALPEGERGLFVYERRGLRSKYPGFVIRDGARGRIQPYFTHLFPVWVALLDAGLGPRGGLYAAPLFALAAVGMLAALGGALFGAGTGAAAALLLGFSVPAAWAARYQVSEPLALFFGLGGWLATVLALRGGRPAWAAVAALGFGCALLAKITTVLPVLVAIGVLVATAAARRERRPLLLAVGFAAALAATAPYLLTACREYAADVFRSVLVRRGLLGPRGVLAAAGALAAAVGGGALAARRPAAARAAAGALLVGLAGAGWFLRPALEHSTDAANLPELGWFLTPLLPLLALAGLLVVLRRPGEGRAGEARLAFLVASATTGALLLHHKQIAPIYPWALRRYVPELLPALALFAAVALAALRGSGPWRRPRALAAAALLAAVVGAGLWRGRTIVALRDNEGALAQVGAVAAAIPAGAVTVCVDGWLATPLERVFDRPVLALSDPTPEKGVRAARAIGGWVAAGRTVYLATLGDAFFTREFGLVPAGRFDFDLPELERTARHYPRAVRRFAPEVALQRVVPAGDPGAVRPPRIDVALAPFGLGKGFHEPERTDQDGRTRLFRWTAGRASLDLPAPPPGRPWTLALSLGGGRPAGLEQPRVRVTLDGRLLGEAAVGAALGQIRMSVPAAFLPGSPRGFVELTVEAGTFVPAEAGVSGDARELGVMWESAAVEP